MENNKNMGFGTRAIHAGQIGKDAYGAVTMPIYQTSTFEFSDTAHGGRVFAGTEAGYAYTRTANPSRTVLENRIAELEGSEACVSFSSGMGAISSVFWTFLKAGVHIIADCTLYGCTFSLINHTLTKYGVEVTFVDLSNAENLKSALKENTCLVYVETPANPTCKIIDLKKVASIAHGYRKDIRVVVDNTFATPYIQRPIELGCDIVVHSATKYLNGHGDVLAGLTCGKLDDMTEIRGVGLKDATGAVLGPFEAFLITRGLKTLEIRMDRHCETAKKVAEFLSRHMKVEKVNFPGLLSHPNHDVAKAQMSKFGAMMSFEVKGGREAGAKMLDSLKLCTLAVSLGDAETLIEHPASMTHATYTPEELKEAGIAEGLIRLAVGLENADDIIADLKNGLDNI